VSDPSPELGGTWYVVRTSIPFWRRRTDPSISYTVLPDGRMTDTVLYRRRGRDRVVLGLDAPTAGERDAWTWRGVGATRLLTSRWRVVAHEGPWLVTLFARTPFTAAGLDLCWRRPDPAAAEVAAVVASLARLPAAASYVDRLFAPVHMTDR
jgi:hypothetical protein